MSGILGLSATFAGAGWAISAALYGAAVTPLATMVLTYFCPNLQTPGGVLNGIYSRWFPTIKWFLGFLRSDWALAHVVPQ
jgi:hypothetical protein